MYFSPRPASNDAYTAEFTQNEKLITKESWGNSTYLHEDSGTVVLTIVAEGETWSESVALRYDTVLWNRRINASLRWDAENPILKVSLLSDNAEISNKSLTDAIAYSGNNHDGTRGIKCMIAGDTSSTAFPDFYVNQTCIMQIRAYQDSEYYLDNLVLDIELPTAKIGDKYYTMEYVSITSASGGKEGSIAYDYVEERISDTKLRITIPHVHLTGHVISNIYLTFPQELKGMDLGGKKYLFHYTVQYTMNDDTPFVPGEKGSSDITLDTNYGGKLEFYRPEQGYGSVNWPDSGVASLGTSGIRNTGNVTCEDIQFRLTFDDQNTNAIGVTSVNLLADTTQQTITVKYRMVDAQGNLYPAENEEPYTKTVNNPHYNKTTDGSKRYITFYRGMLDPGLQGYFFKTVEYTIGSLKPSETIGAIYSYRAKSGPGAFWGKVLRSDLSYVTSRVEILSATDVELGSMTPATASNWNKQIRTNITDSKEVLLTTYAAFSKSSIQAGNSVTLTINGTVSDSITTQKTPYLDEIRIGLLLPAGAHVQESSIQARLTDSNVKLPLVAVEGPRPENTSDSFYLLKFAEGFPIGGATEAMKTLPLGARFQVSVDIVTEKTMKTTDLIAKNIVFVSGKGWIVNTNSQKDTYNTNETGGTSDDVGYVSSEAIVAVYANDVSMDVVDTVLINGVEQSSTTVKLHEASDTIDYRLNIKNQNGGSADVFVCYIAVPQNNFINGPDTDKIVMRGAGQVENVDGSTAVKLQYTTKSVTYDTVETLTDEDWSDSVDDWSTVTMVRIVSADGTPITNGSESTITIPMSYQGQQYSYHAGASVVLNAKGEYNYVRGKTGMERVIEPADRTVELYYKAASDQGETTLTAALNRLPTSPNINQWTYDTDLTFYNAQNFTVQNIQMYYMELVDMDYEAMKEMNRADSNQKYKIVAALGETLGASPVTVLDSAQLGSAGGGTEVQVTFALYNGNALSDAAINRYVTFDLVSDYVTIPVRININQEVAMVSATKASIAAGKMYIPIQETNTTVEISRDSAFTAQFVANGVNESNYPGRTLQFASPLPQGATIALLDYSMTPYHYAYYVAKGTETAIDLGAFTVMGGTGKYKTNAPTGSFDEQLLFVVDFSQATCAVTTNTITLKLEGSTDENDKTLESLTFKTKANRTFTLTASAANQTYGNNVSITYRINNAEAKDSKYDGRKLALLVTSTKALPLDAVLTVGGKTYTQNALGQFIVPLTEAQSGGSYSLNLCLDSDAAAESTLNIALYVSATAEATKPLKGNLLCGPLSVTFKPTDKPSLKIYSMSDRALTGDDLRGEILVEYQTANIPADGSVTLEIQKMIGTAYTTDSIYLEKINGSAEHDGGVFSIPNAEAKTQLKLQFNPKLDVTNYQLLFKILDSSGKECITVPYRFIVTK